MTLKKYYSSSHWRKLRDSKLNDFDVTCAICGRRRWTVYKRDTKKHKKGDRKRLLRFNLHHIRYDNLGHENEKDLLPVCSFCHDYGHNLERAARMSNNTFGPIYQLFKTTTDWDYVKRLK